MIKDNEVNLTALPVAKIPVEDRMAYHYYCPKCHRWLGDSMGCHYCPSCGKGLKWDNKISANWNKENKSFQEIIEEELRVAKNKENNK